MQELRYACCHRSCIGRVVQPTWPLGPVPALIAMADRPGHPGRANPGALWGGAKAAHPDAAQAS
jgi:hypothetical protein